MLSWKSLVVALCAWDGRYRSDFYEAGRVASSSNTAPSNFVVFCFATWTCQPSSIILFPADWQSLIRVLCALPEKTPESNEYSLAETLFTSQTLGCSPVIESKLVHFAILFQTAICRAQLGKYLHAMRSQDIPNQTRFIFDRVKCGQKTSIAERLPP